MATSLDDSKRPEVVAISLDDSKRPAVVALLDLDCWYVQVEKKKRGISADAPCAVQQYGRLLAVDYVARQFGVERGMGVDEAKKLCPNLLTPHVPVIGADVAWAQDDSVSVSRPERSAGKASLDLYRSESDEIFSLLAAQAPLEKASIDEAYVDLTDLARGELETVLSDPGAWAAARGSGKWDPDAEDDYDALLVAGSSVCMRLRAIVKEQLGYEMSAGIAPTKMLAKLGCHKPNQQTVVLRHAVLDLLAKVEVTAVGGLGGKLGEEVKEKLPRVRTAADLASVSPVELRRLFGERTGDWLYAVGAGTLCEDVKVGYKPKSLSAFKSFKPCSNNDLETLGKWLGILADELVGRLKADEARWGRKATAGCISWWAPNGAKDWSSGGKQQKRNGCSRKFALPNGGRNSEALAAEALKKLRAAVSGAGSISRLQLSIPTFVDVQATSVIDRLRAAPAAAPSSPMPSLPTAAISGGPTPAAAAADSRGSEEAPIELSDDGGDATEMDEPEPPPPSATPPRSRPAAGSQRRQPAGRSTEGTQKLSDMWKRPRPRDEPAASWTCPACTVENENMLFLACKTCSAVRPQGQ